MSRIKCKDMVEITIEDESVLWGQLKCGSVFYFEHTKWLCEEKVTTHQEFFSTKKEVVDACYEYIEKWKAECMKKYEEKLVNGELGMNVVNHGFRPDVMEVSGLKDVV